MKAIIPTAGFGTRLQPFTHTTPKVLLQVADKPILGHIIEELRKANVRDVTFVVGYLGDRIEEYVRRQYPDLNARFVEQAEPRGLGHAIYVTADLHRESAEPLLILLGDTVIDVDLAVLRGAETDRIGVAEVDDPHRFGIVELDGERISAMVEKPERPKTNLAIVGIYYITRPALLFECLDENVERGMLTKGEIQLTDALQRMLDKGVAMKAFKVEGWYDCGKPETLLSTNRALLDRRFPEGVEALRRRYPTAAIEPPVWIAPSAQVSHSVVGPHVSIAGNAIVDGSVIQDSIINEGARVRGARLAGSIVGNGAIVSARTVRLYVGDKSEVTLE
ncbi:MAG TPA: sugar phosphate nucleotidyltransferase [Sumerlaeia bacterium]|nr:sugar phosphate nucleotidyltransferase [Sumerlaeia bacterium]